MSSLADDTYHVVLKKLSKLRKKQPWQSTRHEWARPLRDDGWEKVGEIILDAMDEMKKDGAGQPLSALQELAFADSLRSDAAPHVHTAALWLTDTRLRVEAFRADPNDAMMRSELERRGLMKPRNA